MEIPQAAPLQAMPTPRVARSAAPLPRHPAGAWHGAGREESRGHVQGSRAEALTEDDEEPDDKSHDGEDQPPVADGLIVWGGGEPSRHQPGRAAGLCPQRRARAPAWEGAARGHTHRS